MTWCRMMVLEIWQNSAMELLNLCNPNFLRPFIFIVLYISYTVADLGFLLINNLIALLEGFNTLTALLESFNLFLCYFSGVEEHLPLKPNSKFGILLIIGT